MQPISQVLLRVEQALQDEIVTDSGIKFYIDPTYRKEWQATVVATIEKLPIKVREEEKAIFDQLQVGDTVAISYQVVADFSFESDSDRFMLVTGGDDRYREYVNSKGHWLKIYCLPGKISPLWVGILEDNRMQVIDGVQGNESHVSRWASQFPIGSTDIYTFKNLFNYNGVDYWKCDLNEVFAKKVNGQWEAVGNRAICQPIDEIVPNQFLISNHQGQDVKIRYQDRATVLSTTQKDFTVGDVVFFNQNHLEKYEFENKTYYLIRNDFIQGKLN